MRWEIFLPTIQMDSDSAILGSVYSTTEMKPTVIINEPILLYG